MGGCTGDCIGAVRRTEVLAGLAGTALAQPAPGLQNSRCLENIAGTAAVAMGFNTQPGRGEFPKGRD
jgi:hypothetical protein